ncbi:MAG: hypothetical protein KAW14_01840 [Candidatus Aegiribacteria sp.]|nr:hypothetical protein [Candidatus Aegiribacteria sp.]
MDIVAGSIGFAGLVLGLINLIKNIKKESAKVKIVSECASTEDHIQKISYRAYNIEIVNISSIKISITDTGIQFRKWRKCEYYKIDPPIGLPAYLGLLEKFGFIFDERYSIPFLMQKKFKGKIRMRVYCKHVTEKMQFGKWERMNLSDWKDFNEESLPIQNRIDFIYG